MWSDRITTHAIGERLKSFQQVVEQIEPQIEKDPQAIEALERVKTAVHMLTGAMDAADKELVSPAILNTCSDHVQNINSQLVAYLPNGKNFTYLANANSHVDSLLPELIRIPAVRTSRDAEKIGAAVASLRKSIGKYHGGIKADVEKAQADVVKLSAKAAEVEQRFSALTEKLVASTTEMAAKFSESEGKAAASAAGAEQTRNGQFNLTIQKFTSDFAEAERNRDSEAKAARDKAESAATKNLEDAKATLQQAHNDLNTKAGKVLGELDDKLKRAEELMHVIGSTGMAGEYQKVANKAKIEAYVWQGVALASLVGLIVFATTYILPALQQSLTWEAYSARIFITSGFAALAAYGAGQARRLHKSEGLNRDMQLRLSSIGPYIEPLQPDRRHKILEDLVEPFFGGEKISKEPTKVEERLVFDAAQDLLLAASKGLKK